MSTENRPTQGTTAPSAATTPPPAPAAKERRDGPDTARLVALAIVAGLLIAFIVQNSGTVTVHFVFFSARVSLIWALVLAAVLGALLDRLARWRWRRQRARKAQQQASR